MVVEVHGGVVRGRERREDLLDGVEPRRIGGARLEGNVDGRAPRLGAAALVDEAGPGEERMTCLVEGDGQDLWIVPEDRLDAVSVVDVQVDIQNPMTDVAGPPDRQRDIVVDAEAAGATRHCMVEPSTGVEGVQILPGQDVLHGSNRAAGDHGRCLVHAVEGRVVAP